MDSAPSVTTILLGRYANLFETLVARTWPVTNVKLRAAPCLVETTRSLPCVRCFGLAGYIQVALDTNKLRWFRSWRYYRLSRTAYDFLIWLFRMNDNVLRDDYAAEILFLRINAMLWTGLGLPSVNFGTGGKVSRTRRTTTKAQKHMFMASLCTVLDDIRTFMSSILTCSSTVPPGSNGLLVGARNEGTPRRWNWFCHDGVTVHFKLRLGSAHVCQRKSFAICGLRVVPIVPPTLCVPALDDAIPFFSFKKPLFDYGSLNRWLVSPRIARIHSLKEHLAFGVRRRRLQTVINCRVSGLYLIHHQFFDW